MGYQYWPDDFPSEYKTPLLLKNPRKKSLRERIPARYVLTLLTFLGLGIQYTQRVNLNVTMVAMVNSSFIAGTENDTTLDECPNVFLEPTVGHDNLTTPVAVHHRKEKDLLWNIDKAERHYGSIEFSTDSRSAKLDIFLQLRLANLDIEK